MIVYDLSCATHGHRFEGWFSSSDDFARQSEGGLLACPQCGCADVRKAPMAPAVPRKGASAETVAVTGGQDTERKAALDALTKLLEDSQWVGKDFTEQARQMHYGERDSAAIHGEATLADAKEMLDEGIGVAPLPLPVTPPDKLN
ncbi:DUF1178 family protein [Blastomonas marina]|uniref:DUF1178 family protein n=1 Tax=Blastomonas marina TaxID=1867408 RepID=UPI002AC8C84C|nr:DUF1178 family protein [Blastomonas marina]WPZ04699.1 DUF1178 family protein [Blastomonas marina]